MIPSWFPTKHFNFNNNKKVSFGFKSIHPNPFVFYPTSKIDCFRRIAKMTEIANVFVKICFVSLTNQRCSAICWQENPCRISPSIFCGIKNSDTTQCLNLVGESKQWFPNSILHYNIYSITGMYESYDNWNKSFSRITLLEHLDIFLFRL